MKIMIIFFIVFQSAFAIDTGDGSDGACNVKGGQDTLITASRKSYQCTTLDLDANLDLSGSGGSALVIKVQGDVVVFENIKIDLSGADGREGDEYAVKLGGTGGPGGGKGGDAPGFTLAGLQGTGEGAGSAGLYVTPFISSSYGGGGGGGSYKVKSLNKGVDGDSAGAGSVQGTGGLNGSVYGDEANFESTFLGGSGGAAGGAGMNTNIPINGSSGGGGGGALHIIAGRNIDVNGWLSSEGGNGGGFMTTQFAGGGGAGSGGAIWLQAAGDLTVYSSGKTTTSGGRKGNNFDGYNGGDGGEGRIRLDDSDGIITTIGSPTISSSPHSKPFVPTAIPSAGVNAITKQYKSGVSCASVALDEPNRIYINLMNLILGLIIVFLAHFSLSKKSKV